MLSLQPADIDAIRLSLKVATAATLLSTPLGIGVAWLLVHTRIPGKSLIEGLVNLPLVLPPVVVGYLLLVLFGRRGFLGSWLMEYDIQVIFTLTGAVIASREFRPDIGLFLQVARHFHVGGIVGLKNPFQGHGEAIP